MSAAEVLDAPDLTPRDARLAAWESERLAFQRLLPTLLATLRGKYVAVYCGDSRHGGFVVPRRDDLAAIDGEVVATGDDEAAVARVAYDKHGYVPLFVDLVTDEVRKPVRIRSPRVVRPAVPASPDHAVDPV